MRVTGVPTHMADPLYNAHFRRTSAIMRAVANHNPRTICAFCGHTLDQHPPTRTGKPQHWEVDHERPGDPTSPLRIAASSCNRTAGAAHGNRLRVGLVTTRQW